MFYHLLFEGTCLLITSRNKSIQRDSAKLRSLTLHTFPKGVKCKSLKKLFRHTHTHIYSRTAGSKLISPVRRQLVPQDVQRQPPQPEQLCSPDLAAFTLLTAHCCCRHFIFRHQRLHEQFTLSKWRHLCGRCQQLHVSVCHWIHWKQLSN